MSVSDPAPLPRLGEVFFDVRGNSRSMRLSWYANTGVAVFSIWQAGMCTGTFRLPIADLSRMIELLERGPAPQGRGYPPVSASRPGEDRQGDSDWYYGPDGDEPAAPEAAGGRAGRGTAHTDDYARSDYQDSYGSRDARPAGYDGPGYDGPGYDGPGYDGARYDGARYDGAGYDGRRDGGPADYGHSGHGHSGHGHPGRRDRDSAGGGDLYGAGHDYGPADYGPADYGSPDRAEDPYATGSYGLADGRQGGAGDYRSQEHPVGHGRGEYAADDGYRRGYEQAGYSAGGSWAAEADYLSGEYPGYQGERGPNSDRSHPAGDYDDRHDSPTGGHRRDDGGFRRGASSPSGSEADGSPYGDERFAAPYEGSGPAAYLNDNPGPGGGYQADIGDAAYPADRRSVSGSERYLDPPAPEEAYSYGADYRYR